MKLSAKIYDLTGQTVGSLDLPASVFGVHLKPAVLHQVVVADAANARAGGAHTKTRGEVRGGGRKPWKQKGTARARAGSIRSPLWIGGGVTFGPRPERDYTQKVNQKVRQLALKMVLSDKAQHDNILLLEDAGKIERTKHWYEFLNRISYVDKKVVISLDKESAKALAAGRNLPNVRLVSPESLNATAILKAQALLTTQQGIQTLINRLSRKD